MFDPSITPLPALNLSPKNVRFFHSPVLYHAQNASHPQAIVPPHSRLLSASADRGFSQEGPSCL